MRTTRGLDKGQRLGPYQIDRFVAAGGMGEVDKAHDTRLGRPVAVKRLTGPHSQRFHQEARAIAALNHPHICQLYDVGSDYLVLEFIEGEPPRGPLPVSTVPRLATQIAGALEAAHARGILHRDLKPSNILVGPTGHAKLLDFGLAKQAASDADVTRTTTGAVVGTTAYMSPEQAEGRHLDERSDIFSFGAVLYEWLSGRKAFEGSTNAQVLSAVLRDDPPPLDTHIPALNRIVTGCLAKSPGERPQSITDVRISLEEIARERAAPRAEDPRPSVAVLPFADMSAGKDQEWFSDGLAEEIINALARIRGLRVIARTSAFAFKGKQTDVRRIAHRLGVGHILEGSVRQAGNRIRVTAQLIAAADGSHLWSERYDRDMDDVLAIQDDIARTISTTLKVRLTADPLRRRPTPSTPAYEALLKARYHLLKFMPDSLQRARDYLEQAIALEPDFAMAHAALGSYFNVLSLLGLKPARETAAAARAALERALQIDPSLGAAYAALGDLAATREYDWVTAERCFQQMTLSGPVEPWSAYYYAQFLLSQGRPREAAEHMERAIHDDPVNASLVSSYANCLASDGRAEEASSTYSRALELDAGLWVAYEGLAIHQAFRGLDADALAAGEKAHALAPWNPTGTGMLAGLLRRTGDGARSTDVLQQLGDGQRYGAPIGHAIYHAICGESDAGAEWLEKAIEQRDPRVMVFLRLATGAVWRASSRWTALAKMMNLPDFAS
ncbi:MAG TPA: protein kinase [Vicinamibacterales bacterium]|nr:protein kinase [Vicinamibacterales bacterium]